MELYANQHELQLKQPLIYTQLDTAQCSVLSACLLVAVGVFFVFFLVLVMEFNTKCVT